jgi:hypothetical protein
LVVAAEESHFYKPQLLVDLYLINLMEVFFIDIMHMVILEVIKLSVLVQWVHIIPLKFFVGVQLAVRVDKVAILVVLEDLDIELLLS